jgi:cytoplasmic iron level regulating protein YaaA (DUF328/UPF0246 family)
VLLPPSEGKIVGGVTTKGSDTFAPSLEEVRRRVFAGVCEILDSGGPDELAKVLKVKGPILERSIATIEKMRTDDAPLLPAWQRYSGVAWKHLDPASLSQSLLERILIPSGLYGVTTGTDVVADYRMKMNVSLGPLGVVSNVWRPHISMAVGALIQGGTVVDLLPKEHEASIDFDELSRHGDVIVVRFLDHAGNRAAGHDAKAVKGMVARSVLEKGVDSLASFRWKGWRTRQRAHQFQVIAPKERIP